MDEDGVVSQSRSKGGRWGGQHWFLQHTGSPAKPSALCGSGCITAKSLNGHIQVPE